MPLGVHHLAVRVADLDRAEAFYAGILGLPVLRRHDDDAGRPRAIWLGLDGGAFLALELAPDASRPHHDGPAWHCVALAIGRAERQAWRARLDAAGHAVVRETSFTIYTLDPDRNLVGLSHHPDPV